MVKRQNLRVDVVEESSRESIRTPFLTPIAKKARAKSCPIVSLSKQKQVRFTDDVDESCLRRRSNSLANVQPMIQGKKGILSPRARCFARRHTGTLKDMILSIQESDQLLESLSSRTVRVIKIGYNGARETRFVRLSDDGLFLLSRGPSTLFWKSKVDLLQVKRIVIGPLAQRFFGYKWTEGKPWLCFSLVSEFSSFDVECENQEDFDFLVLGLQHHIPLTTTHKTKAQLRWHCVFLKTMQMSLRSKLDISRVWNQLVEEAKSFEEALRTGKTRPDVCVHFQSPKPTAAPVAIGTMSKRLSSLKNALRSSRK